MAALQLHVELNNLGVVVLLAVVKQHRSLVLLVQEGLVTQAPPVEGGRTLAKSFNNFAFTL